MNTPTGALSWSRSGSRTSTSTLSSSTLRVASTDYQPEVGSVVALGYVSVASEGVAVDAWRQV